MNDISEVIDHVRPEQIDGYSTAIYAVIGFLFFAVIGLIVFIYKNKTESDKKAIAYLSGKVDTLVSDRSNLVTRIEFANAMDQVNKNMAAVIERFEKKLDNVMDTVIGVIKDK